ncbi:MAG: hypothetical protein ACTSUE_20105 [Promethearchaeota archaeon]
MSRCNTDEDDEDEVKIVHVLKRPRGQHKTPQERQKETEFYDSIEFTQSIENAEKEMMKQQLRDRIPIVVLQGADGDGDALFTLYLNKFRCDEIVQFGVYGKLTFGSPQCKHKIRNIHVTRRRFPKDFFRRAKQEIRRACIRLNQHTKDPVLIQNANILYRNFALTEKCDVLIVMGNRNAMKQEHHKFLNFTIEMFTARHKREDSRKTPLYFFDAGERKWERPHWNIAGHVVWVKIYDLSEIADEIRDVQTHIIDNPEDKDPLFVGFTSSCSSIEVGKEMNTLMNALASI